MPYEKHGYLYVILGKRLRAARDAAGLTQAEVAGHLGYGQSMISNCERGARRVDAFELREFAELYEVPVEDLLGSLKSAEELYIVRQEDDAQRR